MNPEKNNSKKGSFLPFRIKVYPKPLMLFFNQRLL